MTYTILQAELAQGPCPACGQPITYDYAIDATELQTITLEASKTVVDMQVDRTVVGVRIHHDCIPDDHELTCPGWTPPTYTWLLRMHQRSGPDRCPRRRCRGLWLAEPGQPAQQRRHCGCRRHLQQSGVDDRHRR